MLACEPLMASKSASAMCTIDSIKKYGKDVNQY